MLIFFHPISSQKTVISFLTFLYIFFLYPNNNLHVAGTFIRAIRAVDLHSFLADPDPAALLNADPYPAAFLMQIQNVKKITL